MLGRVFKKWRVRDKCAYLMVVYPVEVSAQLFEETDAARIVNAISLGSRRATDELELITAGGVDTLPAATPVSHSFIRLGSGLFLSVLIRYHKRDQKPKRGC